MFEYFFEAPSVATSLAEGGQFTASEHVRAAHCGNSFVELYTRVGEEITIAGRADPIRVSRFASSIAALSSLLPADDPLHKSLIPVSTFFAGVSYYSLGERPDASDFIPERHYRDWLGRFKSGGGLTESVGFRLIYMSEEDPEMLQEFKQLIGPEGLDLIDHFEVNTMSAPNGGRAVQSAGAESYYLITFQPASHMGGAGLLFPFSQLSLGTRRAIRAVASLLFDKRSLMLIEQLEDSIHPELLRKLIDVFRSYSGNSQIIFTTHSPEVLDVLRPEEVILVSRMNYGMASSRANDRVQSSEKQRIAFRVP